MGKTDGITSILRAELTSGRYQPGSRFPSEYELAERFQVHKITANKAVGLLVNEHLLERGPRGSGTRVLRADHFPQGQILFIGTISHPYVGAILAGAQRQALIQQHVVSVAAPRAEDLTELLPRFDTSHYLGIITLDYGLLVSPLPMIYLDRIISGYNTINCDNYGGGVMMMQEILERGHREVVLYTRGSVTTRHERIRGLQETMLRAGIADAEKRTFRGFSDTAHDALQTLREILKRFPKTTLVATDSDDDALMLVGAAWQMGLKIPNDLSITGFGNVRDISTLLPIASIDQHPERVGALACSRLIELAKQPQTETFNEVLDVELVGRHHIPKIV